MSLLQSFKTTTLVKILVLLVVMSLLLTQQTIKCTVLTTKAEWREQHTVATTNNEAQVSFATNSKHWIAENGKSENGHTKLTHYWPCALGHTGAKHLCAAAQHALLFGRRLGIEQLSLSPKFYYNRKGPLVLRPMVCAYCTRTYMDRHCLYYDYSGQYLSAVFDIISIVSILGVNININLCLDTQKRVKVHCIQLVFRCI